MPLSELYKMVTGKLESPKQISTPCSTDLSFPPDNEIVELIWENGQVMMQGQSSRARKSPASNDFESHSNSRTRDKYLVGNNASISSKMGRFGLMDSVLDGFQTVVPTGEPDFGQDEGTVPWLNYPMNAPLQHDDYCPELLPELSGVTTLEVSVHNSFASLDKRISFNQATADSPDVVNGRSLLEGNASIISGDSVRSQAKQALGLRNSNFGFLNISHSSRPAARAAVNLQHAGSIPTHGIEASLGAKSNEPVLRSGNLAELMPNLSPASRKVTASGIQTDFAPSKVDSKPVGAKPIEDLCFVRESDTTVKDRSPAPVLGETATNGTRPDREKNLQPVVASSSSLCSVNGAGRASDSPTPNLKRKCRETDDSECRSTEDVDEELVGVRKAAAPPAREGTSSKKGRAAEVHNLSERRRRDKINEKMRALQELIPNCNKADKASMLDEAIEYLKKLQLQVQIMSTGPAGLYMPQMMLPPAGMQPLHAAHMACLYPIGAHMGMGFGMGALDMNSGTPGRPMFAVPPIQLPSSFHGGPGSNFQILGHHPGQGLQVSTGPCPPLVPFPVGYPSNIGLNAAPELLPHSGSPTNSKDLMQNSNSKVGS